MELRVLTLLCLEELVELFAFIIHRLLLEVGSDLLDGEVGHVHFHQVQQLKDLPEALFVQVYAMFLNDTAFLYNVSD